MAGPVAIIGGTGALGSGRAARWSRAGVDVIIGSRDAGRAQQAAQRAGAAEGLENGEAAPRAEVAALTVPFRNQSENLTNLKGVLREGQLLVDCTVPLAAAVSGRATRMLGVWQGSADRKSTRLAPDGVRVVSALHTISAATLGDLDAPLDE